MNNLLTDKSIDYSLKDFASLKSVNRNHKLKKIQLRPWIQISMKILMRNFMLPLKFFFEISEFLIRFFRKDIFSPIPSGVRYRILNIKLFVPTYWKCVVKIGAIWNYHISLESVLIRTRRHAHSKRQAINVTHCKGANFQDVIQPVIMFMLCMQ